MIEVNGVTKRFQDFTAIDKLSMKVEKSSIYGLVGYNGAGKTTLLKTIAGVYKPDEGEVKIFGENVFDNPGAKQRLFYVPDEIFFEQNSTLASMGRFYAGFFPRFSTDTLRKLADAFELDIKKHINGFSKGMQRQSEIILAMSAMPEILLLDESFDGIDPAKRNLIKNLTLEYMAEHECSVIISSHNLHELADLCDHIALINGKKVVLDCSVDDISGSRYKFRMVFDHDVDENDFKDIDCKHFSIDGKIVSLSVNGDMDENERMLTAMNPLMIERFPLTLEEIFLEEMEDSPHNFKEIFGSAEGKNEVK